MIAGFAAAGFAVEVLHRERNARTANVAATVVTIRATKPTLG